MASPTPGSAPSSCGPEPARQPGAYPANLGAPLSPRSNGGDRVRRGVVVDPAADSPTSTAEDVTADESPEAQGASAEIHITAVG
jgi:hypothetical protein